MTVRFTIPGIPVGKARPRVTRAGHAYTPNKTRLWESQVAVFAAPHFSAPLTGPIVFGVVCVFPRTKAQAHILKGTDWPKYGDRRMWKSTRPDLDNCVKAVADALDGIAWKDDGQIVRMSATKFAARMIRDSAGSWREESPHVEVSVTELGDVW